MDVYPAAPVVVVVGLTGYPVPAALEYAEAVPLLLLPVGYTGITIVWIVVGVYTALLELEEPGALPAG